MNADHGILDATSESNRGVYVIVFDLIRPVGLTVGALGHFTFRPGAYLFDGSARRNLRQRVARHFRADDPTHWHIDDLTTAGGVHPSGALLVSGRCPTECALNRAVGDFVGRERPVPGFGSSDCRCGCPGHLWYSTRQVNAATLSAWIERRVPMNERLSAFAMNVEGVVGMRPIGGGGEFRSGFS